jgi:hypothetical protein
MNSSDPSLSAGPDYAAPASLQPRRNGVSESKFLGISYVATLLVASLFISLCGPGCCYVFFSIIAGVSGVLMLRRSFPSRCFCLGVLLLSLIGMWHEKETRDTWEARELRVKIETLQQDLQKDQSK